MSHSSWTRRSLLARLGMGASMLPFLPLLNSDAQARGGEFPKRLIIWFYPNGTLPDAYFPKTQGKNFEMTPILEPMARHRDKMIVTRGVNLHAYDASPIKIVHISCVAPLLTGYSILDGDQNEGATSYGWAGGPSVDQFLAKSLGTKTSFPSLEFHNVGMKDEFKTQYRIIYKGPDQPITGMRHPALAFDRIVDQTKGKDSVFVHNELSVLDGLTADLKRLRARIPADERVKMDAHLQSVREVEQRLKNDPLACDWSRPTELDGVKGLEDGTCGEHDNSKNSCLWDHHYDDVHKSTVDVLVQALRCDATRFASVQNGAGGRGHNYREWSLAIGDEHLMSHDQPTHYVDVKRWYMERLAYLVDQLEAVPEGDGTLMDNTLILACSEHGIGAFHSATNIPFLTVGGSWFFDAGQYVDFGNVSNNDLLLSVCQAMGMTDLKTFGDPKFSHGPLTKIHL